MATGTGPHIEEIAQDLFEVFTHFSLYTHPQQRKGEMLKDAEFLTLAILQQNRINIVGEIQRKLGVLPAQMSRIIRSLENRPEPLIRCQINSNDKRKIDVHLTEAGEQAFVKYQEARIRKLVELLSQLQDDDHEEITRLIHKLQIVFDLSRVA